MSIASAHAAAFYREVAASGYVWTIKDATGYPAPKAGGATRAMPFWSSEGRALRVIKGVPAYGAFRPVAIPWAAFRERWIPGLLADELLAGVNWSGERAVGFDVTPADLQRNVEALFNAAV